MSSKPSDTPKKMKTGKKPQPRHLSRIGAVQALYQMDLAGADSGDVIDQFAEFRFVRPVDESAAEAEHESDLIGGDIKFFTAIVKGVVERQRDIDPMVDKQLAQGWRLVRVDSILRAILRAGAYELIARKDVPPRVVINEYINVGHAFFSEDEPRVINGVLDALAGQLRGEELGAKPDAPLNVKTAPDAN